MRVREKKREVSSSFSKMKYHEGGSIGAAEQGGLKDEVAEAITR